MCAGADLGGGCRECRTHPPEMTCGFLIQLVFCKKTMWFIGVEVEQETSAPPPKKILDPPLVCTDKVDIRFSLELRARFRKGI